MELPPQQRADIDSQAADRPPPQEIAAPQFSSAGRWLAVWHTAGSAARYTIASTLFLRLLGAIYLIAFISLWVQVDGLIGSQGIVPASDFLGQVQEYCAAQHPPASRIWRLPTLAWIDSSDAALHLLCAVGVIFSLLLIGGRLPLPALAILWACYLSLFHVGQVFLSFQWDILLLETGFVAIFLAPLFRSRLFRDPPPPRLALWLIWWLLFRLMFESGVVKLTWNDAASLPVANTWESLTALDFHYWTQPLPLWTSWFLNQLPCWVQKISVIGVLLVELVLPFFIFAPPLFRRIACGAFTLMMLVIVITGNYNFFNLLTILLALTLLDDACWPGFFRRRLAQQSPPKLVDRRQWRTYLLVPFAAYAVLLGSLQVLTATFPAADGTRSVTAKITAPQFVLVNSYGLFRRMTETRPEIIIEGSTDGKTWRAYRFGWKPGDLAQRPRLVAPHQPRLDWQMWFEALRLEQVFDATGTINPRYLSPWFQSFLLRLLQGRPEVMGLLRKNPFPDESPKFFRLILYQYRFTDRQEARQTGNWWHRERQWISPSYPAPR
jgi:hypothetical protein